MRPRFLFFAIIVLLSACQRSGVTPNKRYLFAGHIYHWNDQRDHVDCRLEQVDYDQFDGLWLGGDLMQRTTETLENLDYLKELLRIDAPTTHWALGNHDINEGNREWIEAATRRGTTFYAAWENGLLIVPINTNLFIHQNRGPDADHCQQRAAQYDLVRTVLDTVESASHVVFLHHHGLLTDSLTQTGGAGNVIPQNLTFNFYRPAVSWTCDSTKTFEAAIYPLAVATQQRGVEVLFVGGDLGPRRKRFEFTTLDGVTFLGAGLNNSLGKPEFPPAYVTNFNPDSVIFFTYEPEARLLDWQFVGVEHWTGIPDFVGNDGPPCL